jgi:hypothetical protein
MQYKMRYILISLLMVLYTMTVSGQQSTTNTTTFVNPPNPANSVNANKNKLTILSPEEFKAAVKEEGLKSLQNSAKEYRDIRDKISPPDNGSAATSSSTPDTSSTSSPPPTTTTTTTTTNSSTSAAEPSSKAPPDENSSNYYFQPAKKGNNHTTPNTPSGFSPYGTSSGENTQ